MTTVPLISLCMIVRDGGDAFGQCLRSVEGLVDEVVVVDTGSVDDSLERAREAGAVVLRREWSDDFSAARNAGLERARGRWILVLDADERLLPADLGALRLRLQTAPERAFFLAVTSPIGGGERLDVSILRLFRNTPRIRFRGRVHEQIAEDLDRWIEEEGGRVGFLDEPRILHEGYRPEEEERRGKADRNDRLFRIALAERPEDAYLWYKFADALRASPSRRGEALGASSRALALVEPMSEQQKAKLPWRAELLAVHAFELLRSGRGAEAETLVRRDPPLGLGSSSWCFVAALVAENLGQLDSAARWAREATDGPVRPTAPRRPGVRGARGLLLRARIALRRREWKEAEGLAHRAACLSAGNGEACRIRAAALWGRGETSQALEVLRAGFRQNPTDAEMVALLRRLRDRLQEAGRPPGRNLALTLLDEGFAPDR